MDSFQLMKTKCGMPAIVCRVQKGFASKEFFTTYMAGLPGAPI